MGLNPCFNGRYSQSRTLVLTENLLLVLILVLMEDTLRAREYAEQHDLSIVLILVLMEDTLRVD